MPSQPLAIGVQRVQGKAMSPDTPEVSSANARVKRAAAQVVTDLKLSQPLRPELIRPRERSFMVGNTRCFGLDGDIHIQLSPTLRMELEDVPVDDEAEIARRMGVAVVQARVGEAVMKVRQR